MKFKGKIFIYITMVALSLSVMFYGVYAVMTAYLNISGSLGFNPHDTQGTAQILSVTRALNNDGTPYTLAPEDETKVINWQDSATLSLTNPIYLDDISNYNAQTGEYNNGIRIAPIEITLKLTNTSAFAVKTVAKTGVQLQTNTSPATDITGLTYSYEAVTLQKAGDPGDYTDSFVITITPDSEVITEAISITSFAISIEIVRNV